MSVQSGSTYGLRSIIDLSQPYTSFKPFSLTTSSEDAETVLTVSDYMEEAHRITLVVDKNDLYVTFNGTDTADDSSMLIPSGTGYTETDISILELYQV